MKTYLKLWCDWDYGQDAILFENEEDVKAWLDKEMGDLLADLEFKNIEQVFEEQCAGFNIVTVFEKSS